MSESMDPNQGDTGVCDSVNVYKPTIFTNNDYPVSVKAPSKTFEKRSVRFSSIEEPPANRSSLLSRQYTKTAGRPGKAPNIPQMAKERRTDGFSSIVSTQRPKSSQPIAGSKRPIAESTDLNINPDGSQLSFMALSSSTDPRVSQISGTSQFFQESRSEITEVEPSAPVNRKPARTPSVKRNIILDSKPEQPQISHIPAEQEIPRQQLLTAKLLQAEYILLLLRNERLQRYKAFCSFVYTLIVDILKNKTERCQGEVLKDAQTRLAKAMSSASSTLQGVAEQVTLTITPAVFKQFSLLNDAVEACTALHAKGLSLVPIKECADGLATLNRSIAEFLNFVSPIGDNLTPKLIGNVSASTLSDLCRATAKLQALTYEAAFLIRRKAASSSEHEKGNKF